MKNLLRILSFFKELRWRIVGIVIVGSISFIAFAFMPTFLKSAVNGISYLTGAGTLMTSVIKYLLIFGVLAIFNAGFDVFCTYMILKYENKIVIAKMVEVKRKLDVVPASFLEQFTLGDLSRRIANMTSDITKGFLTTIYTIARVIFFFITTAIMMFTMNWILALVVFMSLPLCIFVARLVSKGTQKYFNNNAEVTAQTYVHINQKFSLQEFFTTHGLDDGSSKFAEINKRQTKSMVGEDVATAFNTIYISFIQNFMYLLVTLLFGILYITHFKQGGVVIELGALPAFLMYSNRFLQNAVVVTTATNLLQGIMAKAPRVFEILDCADNVTQKEHIDIDSIKHGITFKNVTFNSKNEKLLDNISFNIPQGASVAFVGPAGGGKTFIIELLSKLAIPTSGEIKVDGISLDEITSKSYYKCVGVSLEQPFIFRGTVAENLLYGVRRALPENVMAVTEMLGSHEFIDGLENGYETFLSENTSVIGQGQKQAICVARLLLQDPDIAIFHQSLSATDTMTEKAVYEKIMAHQKGQTTIFATHRLPSVEKCDIIYYLENGKIVEKSTHKELMARKRKYFKAYMGS